MKKIAIMVFTGCLLASCVKAKKEKDAEIPTETKSAYYKEPFRPQFHFSPAEKWMNDPNGLVYNKGVYHLFYQYYPEDIVWGPMHWGHATSSDLIHWEHKPIALYPDELGYIFSGSAVVDTHNTSGFGTNENPPLVAMFTYHDAVKEKEGRNDYQTQGIAYSLDNGDTWTKYEGNPVIGNTGMKDFRDPKLFRDEEDNRWLLLLVAGDHLIIYSSPDLKNWKQESEFGKDQGSHEGVWECPDMFKLKVNGTEEEKWVLFISINPGAPKGGSGTQYFIGDFDGTTFTSDQKEARWLDEGADNYAGVTFNNVPDNRRIFIGWMSNWEYAQQVPTEKWRSAMTLPRDLALNKIGDAYFLMNYPIPSFDEIVEKQTEQNLSVEDETSIPFDLDRSELRFKTESRDFELTFNNENGEVVTFSINGDSMTFDRTHSGLMNFSDKFGAVHAADIKSLPEGEYEVRIIVDNASFEIFINKGQYTMTEIVFPETPYKNLSIKNKGEGTLNLNNFQLNPIKSIW